MKNKSILFYACTLLLLNVQVFAQHSSPLPPPNSKPIGLPGQTNINLPVSLPNQANNITPSTVNISVNKEQSLLTNASLNNSNKVVFDLNEVRNNLSAEIERLNQAIGHQIRVVMVDEDSDDHKKAIEIANKDRVGGIDLAAQRKITPGAIFATGVFTGNRNTLDTCLVSFNSENANMLWEAYLAPIIKTDSHPKTGYAWVAANALSVCLDAQERANKLTSRPSYRIDELASIGLNADAVKNTIPVNFNSITKEAFFNNYERIYINPIQRQYSERLSDVFATLWIIRLGATKQGITAIANAKFDINGDDEGIRTILKPDIFARSRATTRADRLWDTARDIQQSIGVNSRIMDKTPVMVAANNPDEVQTWKVTPNGLMGVNAKGEVVYKGNTTQQSGGVKNFNELPRFGN